ncbi:MAG: DegT/DnrJ/EryC1/StrS family aminotransferase [Nitrospinota bacterium]|nr:DegT/DnrJ/EryC1/StrS family aminotransferase [Nitrospinota bacterium]
MQFLLHHNVIIQAITSSDHDILKRCRQTHSAGWVLSNALATIHSHLSMTMDSTAAYTVMRKALEGIPVASLTGTDMIGTPPSSRLDYLDSLALRTVDLFKLDGIITLKPEAFSESRANAFPPYELDRILRKGDESINKVPLLNIPATYPQMWNDVEHEMFKVVRSGHFILGPKVEELEEQIAAYTQAPYAVGVSSGTDALLLALMAAGIGPGDEVITSTYTFFASAGSIVRTGAKPVFVDIDPFTFNMDVGRIEAAITPRTKAIMPVHLYGQCVEMPPLLELTKKHNLLVIEDAAQAIGSEYLERRAGGMGDFGCFSFFPTKNLGGFGDAGMVTTRSKEFYEKMKVLRVHGMEPKYYHKMVGGNFRIDALQAAIILAKLIHLESWIDDRRNNAQRYLRLFQKHSLTEKFALPMEIFPRHVFNQYVVRVLNGTRDKLREHLQSHNAGCEVYYPIPLHLQECFKDLGYKKGDFPEAEKAAEETLALPVANEVTPRQQEYVVERIREFIS